MNAICLVIDRLHAGYLGAYGNTWIETPAFDRLAAESFLFEQALIDSPRLEMVYRSYWQGLHAVCPASLENRPTLPGMLREAGVTTVLLTDERRIREHPLAGEFDDVVHLDPAWQIEMAAEGAVEETHLAGCFIQLVERLYTTPRPFLLWCHLASLGAAWDAPLDFRQRYWIEGDPPPSRSAEVPDRQLPQDFDPDEVLGFSQAYAGQVSLLDTCLGGLCEALRDHPAAHETMLALTSPRGFPLGEHRRLGPCDDALYTELVQVPLLIRFPDGLGATDRSQALVEPSDLCATLLDCWRIADVPRAASAASLMPLVREEAAAVRDRLLVAGSGPQRAIRTPAWYLRGAAAPELYVKPDDRWEANNVAVRCLDVVESLQDAAVQYEQALWSGDLAGLPPLADVLVEGPG